MSAGVASVRRSEGLATRLGITPAERVEWTLPDRRRGLQLALAALWLLDGVLQLQPMMFTSAFGSQMLAPFAHVNPGFVGSSIGWVAREVGRIPMLANTVFALLQLGLGVGIAWRRTMKAALVASMVWAVAVWWFGEGLGGLAAGTANPITGAPGAALLYAVLALLLWPVDDTAAPPSGHATAERPLGRAFACAIWIGLWGSFSWLVLAGPNRTTGSQSNGIDANAATAPHWLASLNQAIARDLAHQGLAVAVVLAVVFAVVALGVLAPPAVARWVMVAAAVIGAGIWLVGESLGGMASGQGTDPNSGPLLVLLAAAFWPVRPRPRATPPAATDPAGAAP